MPSRNASPKTLNFYICAIVILLITFSEHTRGRVSLTFVLPVLSNTIIMRSSIQPSLLKRACQLSTSQALPSRFFSNRAFHPPRLSSSPSSPILRHLSRRQQPWQPASLIRHKADLVAPSDSLTPGNPTSSSPTAAHPAYEIYFTCKPCSHRSGPHRVTKQGFHKGTTLITCPSCKNRHVVSDHLRIFTDQGGDLVDIMKRHGGMLKKGKLGIRNGELIGNEGEEEIEFWEDGTETPHVTLDPKRTK
jgi:mitochondrial protein import protein ZIM17